jgi:hypothetical protein
LKSFNSTEVQNGNSKKLLLGVYDGDALSVTSIAILSLKSLSSIFDTAIISVFPLLIPLTLHACLEDTNKVITLACYKLENTEKQAPEKLTIDFNNFP